MNLQISLELTTRQFGLLENVLVKAIEKSNPYEIDSPTDDLLNIACQFGIEKDIINDLEKLKKV